MERASPIPETRNLAGALAITVVFYQNYAGVLLEVGIIVESAVGSVKNGRVAGGASVAAMVGTIMRLEPSATHWRCLVYFAAAQTDCAVAAAFFGYFLKGGNRFAGALAHEGGHIRIRF